MAKGFDDLLSANAGYAARFQGHHQIHEQSGVDTRSLEFRTVSDQRAVLARDVQRIRSSPYLPPGLPVLGTMYDVATGRLEVAVPA